MEKESGAMRYPSTGRVAQRRVRWFSGRAPEDVQQGTGSSTTGALCGLRTLKQSPGDTMQVGARRSHS